jgi:hypothetical protein
VQGHGVSASGTSIPFRAGVGWKPGVVGQARSGADTESPTGYAFKTGEPVISNHLEGESRFRTPTILVEHGIKRAINALIQSDGERLAFLRWTVRLRDVSRKQT